MKPRILWVNECSVLTTGYATYGREVLKRLHTSDKYTLAEHGAYISHQDPRAQQVPWVLYANLPDPNSQDDVNRYNSNPANQFGEWRFEDVCLDFKPHIVMDIRDFWMLSFEYRSPFRPYYNWVIQPTVDAYPQNEEWLSTYKDADGVFTYQDWSKAILDHEGGGKINTLGAAPPAADVDFQPLNRQQLKEQLGFGNTQIIGTIMRNQRRKLYPDLFASFCMFLNETKRDDIMLYCHTSYPDMGWDIPKLLLKLGLSSKVLFTYICKDCNHAFPNFFSDVLTTCPRCQKMSAGMASVQQGVDNKILSIILNTFDLYVQYANSEGFGMPQLEAAACGTPVMSIDYSAMTDAVQKLEGISLPPLTLSMELETGCFRAVPDNDLFIEKLKEFFELEPAVREQMRAKIRDNYVKNYNWDRTTQKWMSYFDTVNIDHYEQLWHTPPKIYEPPTDYPKHLSNRDFATWIILEVLREPRFLNTYMEARLVRDLNYGVTSQGISGMYFNEMSSVSFQKPTWQEFNKETAFKHFVELRKRTNHWENRRWQRIQETNNA